MFVNLTTSGLSRQSGITASFGGQKRLFSEIGFAPFIKEFRRLLCKGGVLTILEPSSFYPFGWVTALAQKIMGNVTGKVDTERPVNPLSITAILKQEGFSNIKTIGLTFNHARFPCVIQNLINLLDYPLRIFLPFFANSIGWYCVSSS